MERMATLSGGGSFDHTAMIFAKSESWCVPWCVELNFAASLLGFPLGSNPTPSASFRGPVLPAKMDCDQGDVTEVNGLNIMTCISGFNDQSSFRAMPKNSFDS
jgi:hypothetical protein